MAKYTGPVMKKCRALGINPADLGISRKSTKTTNARNASTISKGRLLKN